MKDQGNNSDRFRWQANLNLSDFGMADKPPNIDLNFKFDGRIPSSNSAGNPSPEITGEVSQLMAAQEAETSVMKDQDNNSKRSRWQANLNLSDLGMADKPPKADLNLEFEGSLPSRPAQNSSPELTEAISQVRTAQEAETAERERERKLRRTLNPRFSGTSPRRGKAGRKDRPGRGGHEFPQL